MTAALAEIAAILFLWILALIYYTAYGHLWDEGSHIHPLITFLSVCVNARCILLIQTAVFITSNGLWERKEDRGREREREWGETRRWYFYFCVLSGSLCEEGAQTEVELIMETITLSHTLCGSTLHSLSSIIQINIKFLPLSTQSSHGWNTNLPPSQLYIRCLHVIYYSMTAVVVIIDR